MNGASSRDDHIECQLSTEIEDSEWDSFLESTPTGHFQQSSAWAKYKSTEGWLAIRAVYKLEKSIVGGFQLLWKKTKRGKIAYVSKGPVLGENVDNLSQRVVDLVRSVVAKNGLMAVVVQPPDESSPALQDAIEQSGFVSSPFLGIINATLLIDVSGNATEVVSRFRAATRNKYNKAVRNGIAVRDGDASDIPEFFKLMILTCQRQGVHPNPPTEESLFALWNSMNERSNFAHLRFTMLNGELVSGDLLILFGKRITIFKTGWNRKHPELHPNNFRICEILKWATTKHYDIADFVALQRGLAETVLKGEKIDQEQNKLRDAFKLSFGGYPILLPYASLWFPNPVIRICYKIAARIPFMQRKLKGFIN